MSRVCDDEPPLMFCVAVMRKVATLAFAASAFQAMNVRIGAAMGPNDLASVATEPPEGLRAEMASDGFEVAVCVVSTTLPVTGSQRSPLVKFKISIGPCTPMSISSV